MPSLPINDISMYYEEAGQGQPLVLLLGATGSVQLDEAAWGTLLPILSKNFHTYLVEQRGHGRSTNPAGRLSYVQMANDAAAFIAALDLAPAHVAGMSDGGIVGLVLGMTRPDLLRSLVCVGANYRLEPSLLENIDQFSPEVFERESPEWVDAMVKAHDAYHHPGYWRALVLQLQAMFAVEPTYTEADLRTIPTPTLLISGELDHAATIEQMLEMRRSIPRSEMLILNHAGMDAGANHMVQHTRPEIVGPAMLEFLARHASDPVA
jgi:pimeloyl-ACP methyl ester carboxylesterase